MGEVYCRHLALDKPLFRSKILCSLFISMQGQDVSLPILQSPYDQDRGGVHTHGCSGYDHSNWWVTQHLCRSVLLWVHLESLWVAGEIILQTSREICEPCIKHSRISWGACTLLEVCVPGLILAKKSFGINICWATGMTTTCAPNQSRVI